MSVFESSMTMDRAFIQPLLAALMASIIAIRSYMKKSLDLSGAFFGFLVVFIHLATNLRVFFRFFWAGGMLLVFFFTSSQLTKIGAEKKRKSEDEYKEGGQRNWIQVLSNSVIASALVLTIWKLVGWEDKCLDSRESTLITALLGGILVRKGTNGGVTKTGLMAATTGGFVVGLTFALFGFFMTNCPSDVELLVIPLATLAGLYGSLLDSLLGATLQFSGFCTVHNKVVGKPGPTVKRISGVDILDNNTVNCVSILLTTLLTSVACVYIF